ncbi:hypothetical protein BTR23_06235 [Alkalihalophilus pseudofirmus]|uniref:DUF3006 domain-containing protein n=1 Tax=Alkalihalobacterium alkalinitrilicum TaxID=427920 RepID=UPI00094CB066|nr:DUF3006 domain-containing protein [Alkalihalobacterium alkalinitrilicum]OLO40582.1 hypothetical protein BTR23_06235 [Alkalihalophilus pseudofirmus]
MKAVIDRIIGEIAVVLVENEEKEYNISIEKLPANVKEGSIVEVEFKGEMLTILTISPNENKETTKRISDKMSKLRQRKNSQFKR